MSARRAWFFLRGPYMLAYVSLLVLAVSLDPYEPTGYAWRLVASLVSLALVVGSFASFASVNGAKKSTVYCLEMLEVTGLRLLAALEIPYGLFLMIAGFNTSSYAAAHILVGFLSLGVLMNMTWNKKPGRGEGIGRHKHA